MLASWAGGWTSTRASWPRAVATEWVEPHREALRRTVIDASTALAEALADADSAAASRVLDWTLAHDPYNEALYQQAIRLAPTAISVSQLLARLTARLAEIDAVPSRDTMLLADSARSGR